MHNSYIETFPQLTYTFTTFLDSKYFVFPPMEEFSGCWKVNLHLVIRLDSILETELDRDNDWITTTQLSIEEIDI